MQSDTSEEQLDGIAAAIARIVVFVVVTVCTALVLSIIPMTYSRLVYNRARMGELPLRQANDDVSAIYIAIGIIATVTGSIIAILGPAWWNRSQEKVFESMAEIKAASKIQNGNK